MPISDEYIKVLNTKCGSREKSNQLKYATLREAKSLCSSMVNCLGVQSNDISVTFEVCHFREELKKEEEGFGFSFFYKNDLSGE